MKICPICNARCFDDMEICFGCMHRFDILGQAVEELSLFEEIDHQDIPLPQKKFQPRHAALPNMVKIDIPVSETSDGLAAPSTPSLSDLSDTSGGVEAFQENLLTEKVLPLHPSCEGFQAEYQLVISLKPYVGNSFARSNTKQIVTK
ncbi:MAG: hypothetical protein FWG24_05880 [Eggerthellaceae bacterium]|nr:hypothetical protein [Eggerthellaceae bacterium]